MISVNHEITINNGWMHLAYFPSSLGTKDDVLNADYCTITAFFGHFIPDVASRQNSDSYFATDYFLTNPSTFAIVFEKHNDSLCMRALWPSGSDLSVFVCFWLLVSFAVGSILAPVVCVCYYLFVLCR